jgi:Predicted Rossmann fold nucleotide-binding protein involved in DNA uptake
LTVISGLARGIDTAAHQGALAAKGRTIAAIGSGLARLYPPENCACRKNSSRKARSCPNFPWKLNQIAKPSQCEPDHFGLEPRGSRREAGLNSGALITASQALEQGRSVYAVPGHINAPSAMGSNRLIQQGAKLVMDASDILDDLQILLPEANRLPKPPCGLCRLSEEERRVYDAIEASETSIDEITEKTKPAECDGFIDSVAIGIEAFGQTIAGKIFCKAGIGIVLCGLPGHACLKNVSHLQKSCKWVRLPAPMSKSLIIAEKPSVAGDIAKALGDFKKGKDYYENEKYLISWAVGPPVRARGACVHEGAGQVGYEETTHHPAGI